MDVAVFNAWPKDTEGTQAGMAMVPIRGKPFQVLKEGGTVVIASACPEGLGFHSVMGPGTLLRIKAGAATQRHAEGVGDQAPAVLHAVAQAHEIEAGVLRAGPRVHCHGVHMGEHQAVLRGHLLRVPAEVEHGGNRPLGIHDAPNLLLEDFSWSGAN